MNFSVNCHLTASYLSADHFWPKTSKWATPNICEFLEHTRSILINSEHLFMSSQRRGYFPMPTGLDTRWIIFCILWFFFGKTKLHLVIWINFRVEDWVCMLPWKYSTVQLRCFFQTFLRRKTILWLLNASHKRRNKCTSLLFPQYTV